MQTKFISTVVAHKVANSLRLHNDSDFFNESLFLGFRFLNCNVQRLATN
jgi:hypothetical protein